MDGSTRRRNDDKPGAALNGEETMNCCFGDGDEGSCFWGDGIDSITSGAAGVGASDGCEADEDAASDGFWSSKVICFATSCKGSSPAGVSDCCRKTIARFGEIGMPSAALDDVHPIADDRFAPIVCFREVAFWLRDRTT